MGTCCNVSNVTWTNVTYLNATPYKRNTGDTTQCHWSPTVPEETRHDRTCPDLSGGWKNKNTSSGWMMALNLSYNNLSHLVALKMLWNDVQMHRSVPVTCHRKKSNQYHISNVKNVLVFFSSALYMIIWWNIYSNVNFSMFKQYMITLQRETKQVITWWFVTAYIWC